MIRNENQIASLPFYTDLDYQDRNRWWVQSIYRLLSPDDRFLPFQFPKPVTPVGGVSCPVPSTVDYTADFSTGLDDWEVKEVVGNANAVISYDSVNNRVKVVVTSNIGLTTLGVVVRRVRTGARYQYSSGSINTVVRGDSSTDALIGYGIPGAEKALPSTTFIGSGYTLIDSDTWDTNYNEYGLAFLNEYTTQSTFYIESFSASSTPYALLNQVSAYQSDFSTTTDNWGIFGSGSATLVSSGGNMVLTYNNDTSLQLFKGVFYTGSSSIRSIILGVNANQGFMSKIVIIGKNLSGGSITRTFNTNHDFATSGNYLNELQNDDNYSVIESVYIYMQSNGTASTTFTSISIDTLEDCVSSQATLWSTAELVKLDGTTTDIASYMNANTDVETYADYQVVLYNGNTALAASIDNGNYYIHLNDGTDDYYSEVFQVCGDLSEALKIEWWRDSDIIYNDGRVVYNGNYINTMYFDADIGKPVWEYEIQETVRQGIEFVEQISSFKRFKFDLIIPEPIADIIARIPNHEYVTISLNGITYTVIKLNVGEADWVDHGDLAVITIDFKTNNILTNGTGVAQTVNELLANETEAINIRGNNKRIYSLSDTLSLDGLYLVGDKQGLTEAVRFPITELLNLTGFEEEQTYTVPDGSTSNQIVVGLVSRDKTVYLKYTATRGGVEEAGEIEVSSVNDTIIARNSRLANVGMNITKNINGNNIRINIEDTLNDGNNIIFNYIQRRFLK